MEATVGSPSWLIEFYFVIIDYEEFDIIFYLIQAPYDHFVIVYYLNLHKEFLFYWKLQILYGKFIWQEITKW